MTAAANRFANVADTFNGPCRHAEAVTKSDTVNLTNVSRYLWVGGTGDVAVVMQGGEVVTLTAVPAGQLLPICVSRVNSTNTSATNIIAIN